MRHSNARNPYRKPAPTPAPPRDPLPVPKRLKQLALTTIGLYLTYLATNKLRQYLTTPLDLAPYLVGDPFQIPHPYGPPPPPADYAPHASATLGSRNLYP